MCLGHRRQVSGLDPLVAIGKPLSDRVAEGPARRRPAATVDSDRFSERDFTLEGVTPWFCEGASARGSCTESAMKMHLKCTSASAEAASRPRGPCRRRCHTSILAADASVDGRSAEFDVASAGSSPESERPLQPHPELAASAPTQQWRLPAPHAPQNEHRVGAWSPADPAGSAPLSSASGSSLQWSPSPFSE